MVFPVKSQTNSTTLPVPGTTCPSSLASVRVRVRIKVKFGDDKVRSFQCDVFYPQNTSGFLGFGRSKFLHRRARSRFPLAVKFYFFGFCYQGCSRETNKRAIITVAATNLRLDLRRRFLFSAFWTLLEPTGKGFSVLSLGLGLPAGDSGLLK